MSSHWTVAKSIIFDLFWTYLNKVSPFPCNGRVVGIGKMVARRQNGEAEGHKSDVNSISLLFDRAKTTWLHCSSSSAHLSKSTNSSLYPVWTGRYLQLETASPTKHLPSASTEWRVLVLQISSSPHLTRRFVWDMKQKKKKRKTFGLVELNVTADTNKLIGCNDQQQRLVSHIGTSSAKKLKQQPSKSRVMQRPGLSATQKSRAGRFESIKRNAGRQPRSPLKVKWLRHRQLRRWARENTFYRKSNLWSHQIQDKMMPFTPHHITNAFPCSLLAKFLLLPIRSFFVYIALVTSMKHTWNSICIHILRALPLVPPIPFTPVNL